MSAIPLRRIEGKYEILEKLREGGMGAIYKVRHRLLDEIRVIKLMRQQLVEDDELKARFLREARLAIKLRHPNIAQLYDFTVDEDGTAYIVMEFIDGMTLEDVLAFHGPPSLGFTLEIAQQSLRALGYLHLRGFIHRDISPDNLMLTADADDQPLIKLIDLGIAKTLDAGGESHLTQTGTFLGKLRYAPPEQFGADGATTVDARADLYSFGVVLYELLTARFPIHGKDPSSLIAGHLFRPPLDFAETDPAGRIPASLRAVVLKTLAKKPEDRFASAQELSRALAELRTPSDVAEEDLKRLLTRPAAPAGVSVAPRLDPGSTQGRLDENFDLGLTPSPVSLLALASPPAPEEAALRPAGRDRELAAAMAGIEAALERKDYRVAETLLYAAEADLGGREVFLPLYERIAEQRRRAVGERVAAHLESARRLAATRDFHGALREVLKAQGLDPESREAASLHAEIEAGQQRHDEVAALLANARGLAAHEDFKGTLKELRRAARLDPEDPEVRALTEEVEATSRERADAKRRDQQRVRDCKKIEERLARGDLEAAGELLDKAVAIYGEEAVEALRERLDDLRRQERRARALAEAVAEIGDRLDREELGAAGELLDRAVVVFGAADALREQWQRLEEKRRAAKAQTASLQTSLAEARQLAAAGRFDAALEELGRAAELAPADPDVLALKREVGAARRRQKEEKRRAAELALDAAAIEVRLDHADLAAAARLLEKAVADFGDQPPLTRLRARLESLRRQAQTRQTKLPALPEPSPAEPRTELDDLGEAARRIADLLSRREARQALKELQSATLRFGDRAEFGDLRKRIAAMLLDD